MNNIKNIRKLVTTAIMASALAAFPVVAQSVSQSSISFQAVLNNGNGQALPNGSYNLAFRFYAAATGGTAIGVTNVTSVSVVNGVASTAIPVQAAWFDGQTRYLGVSVNGGAELQPRTLVTAVPYAVSASQLSTPIQEQAGLELRWNGDTPFIDFTHAQPLRDFEYRMSVTDRSDPRFVIRSDIADNGLVLRRNGFVGIGVPVPGVALDVKGEIRAQMLTAVAPTYHHALEIRNENLEVPPLAFVSDGWDGNSGAGRYAIHAPYAHPSGVNSGPAAAILYWSGRTLSFGAPELDAARPNFNVGIGTLNPQAKLDVRGTTRTTVLEITSDRNAKRDLLPVSTIEVLERLARLPMTTWAYTNNPTIRHLGPMAQDFHATFGLGGSKHHIATVDADGVALAAIQGLYQIVEEKAAKIRELETRLELLEHKHDNRPATP